MDIIEKLGEIKDMCIEKAAISNQAADIINWLETYKYAQEFQDDLEKVSK